MKLNECRAALYGGNNREVGAEPSRLLTSSSGVRADGRDFSEPSPWPGIGARGRSARPSAKTSGERRQKSGSLCLPQPKHTHWQHRAAELGCHLSSSQPVTASPDPSLKTSLSAHTFAHVLHAFACAHKICKASSRG